MPRKVQKSKIRKLKPNTTLVATMETLVEREGPWEENKDREPLVEGIDLNMVKQETATMECDEIEQISTNLVREVKYEPESFLMTEELSNPENAETTDCTVRKKSKSVKKKREEKNKLAKEQEKRQVRRVKNPNRYEDNTAHLPDYTEISQNLNEELFGPNVNDHDVQLSNVHRNGTKISNIEAELVSGTLSNNVSEDCTLYDDDSNREEREIGTDIDNHNGQESETSMTNVLNEPDALIDNDTGEARSDQFSTNIAHISVKEFIKKKLELKRKTDTDINIGKRQVMDSMANRHNALTGVSADMDMHMDTDERRYQCNQCPKAFKRNSHLQEHIRFRHNGERPYKCNECASAFTQKNTLDCHVLSHTGGKPHKCTKCSSAFAHKNSLKIHMQRHHGEEFSKCTVAGCSSTFTSRGALNAHLRLHTGERPYTCTMAGCTSTFTQSAHLKYHELIHTGEKPHKCSICSSAFVQKSTLTVHMRTHTGEKPYICTIAGCTSTFISSGLLKHHKRIHTREKPHKCMICSSSFAQKGH